MKLQELVDTLRIQLGEEAAQPDKSSKGAPSAAEQMPSGTAAAKSRMSHGAGGRSGIKSGISSGMGNGSRKFAKRLSSVMMTVLPRHQRPKPKKPRSGGSWKSSVAASFKKISRRSRDSRGGSLDINDSEMSLFQLRRQSLGDDLHNQ